MRLLYAVDGNGKVLGVTSWLPTYRDGTVIGWTLDFMRHRTDSVNGIMEFLIARMAERLRDDGSVEFMSLSAAPLAGMGSNESEHEESEVLRHVSANGRRHHGTGIRIPFTIPFQTEIPSR